MMGMSYEQISFKTRKKEPNFWRWDLLKRESMRIGKKEKPKSHYQENYSTNQQENKRTHILSWKEKIENKLSTLGGLHNLNEKRSLSPKNKITFRHAIESISFGIFLVDSTNPDKIRVCSRYATLIDSQATLSEHSKFIQKALKLLFVLFL